MTVKYLHSTSSSGTFKPQKLVQALSPYVLILVFIYVASQIGIAFNLEFVKSSEVLCFPHNQFLIIYIIIFHLQVKFLNMSTHFRQYKNQQSYNFIKNPIKYLELVSISKNLEIAILSALTSQILVAFLHHKIFLLLLFSLQVSTLLY